MQFEENEVVDLGNGVWVRVAEDNVSWCDMGDGVAVIDGLDEFQQAGVVWTLIRQTTRSELRWVVNTHWDHDHIACNPEWRSAGALVIAHDSSGEAAGDWEGRPDITYSERATLHGTDGRRMEMEWVGGTHTPWDCLVYIPHARVLHVGDIFGWGLISCQPTPEKVNRLRTILDKINSYDAKHIICGHGPLTTSEHLRRFRQYLDQLLAEMPSFLRQGLTAEQIEEQLPPPADMRDWWRFRKWKHRRNIELIAEHYSAP